VLNSTEFCGGCISPDGKTFFVSQQGERVAGTPSETSRALTYAIWGDFDRSKAVRSQTFGEPPGEFRRSLAEMPLVS
jgi:secreted PhoX family phosphatase